MRIEPGALLDQTWRKRRPWLEQGRLFKRM
jgi:hypothetical protein